MLQSTGSQRVGHDRVIEQQPRPELGPAGPAQSLLGRQAPQGPARHQCLSHFRFQNTLEQRGSVMSA